MEKRPSISVGQIFSMLFISRMVVNMTYGTSLIGNSEIWDHLISAPIAFVAVCLLAVPIYKLFYMDEKMNIMDNIYSLMGKCGVVLILVYVLYYLIICCHTLAVFNEFVHGAVNPPISLGFLSSLLIFASCYGAYKGLEALARTANFILIATIFSVVFLGISLFSSIEPINFTPLMYNGFDSVKEGALYMISQSSCVPALAVLLPMGKGNKKISFLIWNFAVYIIFSLIVVLIVGSMGSFASTQLFPVYTAAGIGKFGSFRHLDVLYLGIWLSGIFLKLSLFFILAGEGVKKLFGKKCGKILVVACGFLLALASYFPGLFKIFKSGVTMWVLLCFLVVLSVIVPIAVISVKFFKSKKERVKIEN